MLALGIVLVVVGGAAMAVAFIRYVKVWMERAPHPRVQSRVSSVFEATVDFTHGWIRRPPGRRRLGKPLLLFLVADLVMLLGLVLIARHL